MLLIVTISIYIDQKIDDVESRTKNTIKKLHKLNN